MLRRTFLRSTAPALLVIALAIGPAAAAVQSAIAPVAQSSPSSSDRKRAEAAVGQAEKRLNAVERDLQRVVDLRSSIQARIKQAREEVELAGEQSKELQLELSARARSAYMTGAPTSIAALLGSDTSDQLLKRAELLERIADHGTATIEDLQDLREAIDGATSALAEAEQAARENEKQLKVKLAAAEKAFEEKDRVRRELIRKLNAEEARRLAARTAASRVSGVTSSGGVCDLSGVPSAAREIIMRESGGRPTAQNPYSTAFGLGQLILSQRQRYIPSDPNTTDCGLQYQAFKQYVMDRYGSFDAALAFHNANGWY